MRTNTKGLTEAIRSTLIDAPKGMATIIQELDRTWPEVWIKNRITQLSQVNKSGKQYLQLLETDGTYTYKLTDEGMKAASRDIERMKMKKSSPAGPRGGQLFELIYEDGDGHMVLRAEDGTLVQAQTLVLR